MTTLALLSRSHCASPGDKADLFGPRQHDLHCSRVKVAMCSVRYHCTVLGRDHCAEEGGVGFRHPRARTSVWLVKVCPTFHVDERIESSVGWHGGFDETARGTITIRADRCISSGLCCHNELTDLSATRSAKGNTHIRFQALRSLSELVGRTFSSCRDCSAHPTAFDPRDVAKNSAFRPFAVALLHRGLWMISGPDICLSRGTQTFWCVNRCEQLVWPTSG